METLSPFRVLKTALVDGSGGDGQYRGGLGIVRDYEHLAERSVLGAYVQQTRDDTRPWGLAGGQPGGKAAMWLNPDRPGGEQLNSKVIGQVLKKGDVLRLVGAGGGGWGDPAKREKALAERDRHEGFA